MQPLSNDRPDVRSPRVSFRSGIDPESSKRALDPGGKDTIITKWTRQNSISTDILYKLTYINFVNFDRRNRLRCF